MWLQFDGKEIKRIAEHSVYTGPFGEREIVYKTEVSIKIGDTTLTGILEEGTQLIAVNDEIFDRSVDYGRAKSKIEKEFEKIKKEMEKEPEKHTLNEWRNRLGLRKKEDEWLGVDFSSKEWIPVTRSLPEEKGYYLVTTAKRITCLAFWNSENFMIHDLVIAWMESPEPYQGGRD
jgi:hypothetical protein